MMTKLFESADEYLTASDWRDLALVKFCLCAMGVMIGMGIGMKMSRKNMKYPFLTAGAVFVGTYIPLMAKFFKILFKNVKEA